jgi:hypothetical protein
MKNKIEEDIAVQECNARWYLRHYGREDDMLGHGRRIFMLNWCKETLQKMSKNLEIIKSHLHKDVRESILKSTPR